MGIDRVQTNLNQVTETCTTTLEGGPTFFSCIPFHFVKARIFKDTIIYSKTNFWVKAGHNFQLDLSLANETTEYRVLVYHISSSGKKEKVGGIRGNVLDLNQQGTITLVNRILY